MSSSEVGQVLNSVSFMEGFRLGNHQGGNLCYEGDRTLVTEASNLILANLLGFLRLAMFY